MNRKNLTGLIPVVASVMALQGCVVVVGDSGTETRWASTWSEEQEVISAENDKLAKEVSRLLAEDPMLSGKDLSVAARKGVVSLHGRVDSLAMLERAVSIASATPGVSSVISRMSVEVPAQ